VPDDSAGADDEAGGATDDDVVADLTLGEVIDLRFELFHVRRQLDRLAAFRHMQLLSPAEQEAYERLAQRELELLVALVGQPDD
jgi:hypothetical protein